MDFRYGAFFGMTPPDAYERLICDCMAGDNTLFAREDEVFQSWRILTPVLEHWAGEGVEKVEKYEAGSWGPSAADTMLNQDGQRWRLI